MGNPRLFGGVFLGLSLVWFILWPNKGRDRSAPVVEPVISEAQSQSKSGSQGIAGVLPGGKARQDAPRLHRLSALPNMGVYPGSMSVEDRDLRRRLRISSVAAPPPPSPLNGRTFMLEEILIYYPFLRLSDGTYKTNYANAIHANLQSDWDFRQSYATNGITFDEIRKLPGDPVNRDLIPIINERSELFWEARGMEPIDPKTVAAPSSSFLSVLLAGGSTDVSAVSRDRRPVGQCESQQETGISGDVGEECQGAVARLWYSHV